MINLFNLVSATRLPFPRLVCEVGVNAPDKCSVTKFIQAGANAILVEPLPWLAKELREAFPSAMVVEGVVGPHNEKTVLYDRGEGSFIEEVIQSPDEANQTNRKDFPEQFKRIVQSITFDVLDNGKIDLLCVDTEGAEWHVLSVMESRPILVRAETHGPHGYRNPYFEQVHSLMAELGYCVAMVDVSDTLWIKKGGW